MKMNILYEYIEGIKPMLYTILIIAVMVAVALFLIWLLLSMTIYKGTHFYEVTHQSFFKMRFNMGSYGEYLCYRKLRKYEKDGAKFLYNCYLPREKDETTEIDVMMIHTSGIYVLESKNYSGWIFGSEKGKNWTQTLPNGRKANKVHFYNPVLQNKTHIKYLKALIGEEIPVHSLIVFSERCTLKKIDIMDKEVKVIRRDVLRKNVKKIDAQVKCRLSISEVDRLYEQLYPYTQVDEELKRKHIEDIQKRT